MQFRQLGNSGIEVSVLALGSWLTYEFMEEQDALAVISAGLEAGINFLDDARYDDRTGKAPLKSGYSEVVFGNLLRKGGWNRADLIIANKFWYEFYPQQSPEEELAGSLSRLQMDYIDLIYCAPPPASLPVAEMVKQMDDLVKTGKVRYWGILNWPLEKIEAAYQTAMAEGMAPPYATQLAYSLLNPSPVEDEATQEICRSAGIGVVASYSLYGGLLSGKYHQSEAASKGRFGAEQLESMRQKGLWHKAGQVIEIAREFGCTPAQLALAYCLQNPQVSSLLFGATRVSQIQENIGTLEILPRLNQEVMTKLKNLT
jgi:aryl-alcohol dehydrogenase-like predicted oxidoreductase